MAAKNIGQLLEALAQQEVWSKLSDKSIPALRKASDWLSVVYKTPNVQQLVILCRASGGEFGHRWLAQQHAKLIEDKGLDRVKLDAMTVAKFVPLARGLRADNETQGGTSRNGNRSPAPRLGRKSSDPVAQRRKHVKRLHNKGFTPGQIASELRNLQAIGKVPEGVSISVDVVKKDIERM